MAGTRTAPYVRAAVAFSGLTHDEFAKQIGVAPRTLGRWKSDEDSSEPDPEQLLRIFAAAKLSPDFAAGDGRAEELLAEIRQLLLRQHEMLERQSEILERIDQSTRCTDGAAEALAEIADQVKFNLSRADARDTAPGDGAHQRKPTPPASS